MPPPILTSLASKIISLYWVSKIGCKTEPDPFPPSIDADKTPRISKSWGSTITSTKDPPTTGWTKAAVPIPLFDKEISILGGFKTS